MPIYDMYPYSNLHELNLDFIIKLCEEFKDGVEGFEDEIAAAETRLEGEISALQTNLQQQINTLDGRADQMSAMFLMVGSLPNPTRIRALLPMNVAGDLSVAGVIRGTDIDLTNPLTISLTGDVTGSVETDLSSDIEIETTVVGGGGGGETLPKVIFDGTIQGVVPFDQSNYIAVLTQALELIPGNSYTVIFDGTVYDTVFQYTSLTGGYTMQVGSLGQISFNTVLVPDNNEHSVKILQKYAVEKELIYASNNQGFINQDDYYQANGVGLIPELGMGDYTVFWDGVKYDLRGHIPDLYSQDFNPSKVVIGSEEIVSGGTPEYPFCFDGMTIMTNSTELTHSFALYGPKLKKDKVVLYAATNPVLNDYNAVYQDPYLDLSFFSVTDLRQYIQNKTPVISPNNGQIYYPIEFVNDLDDPDNITIVCEERANGNFYMYGIGHMEG